MILENPVESKDMIIEKLVESEDMIIENLVLLEDEASVEEKARYLFQVQDFSMDAMENLTSLSRPSYQAFDTILQPHQRKGLHHAAPGDAQSWQHGEV